MASVALLFLVVFGLNILPAFAPPTWLAMSMFGFKYPSMHAGLVALVAAAGATSGRLLLAHFAGRIVKSRFVSDAMRDNLAGVGAIVRTRRSLSVAVFLLFAFSPLPSNALFLAYGLTRAPLTLLAVPFFLGRFASYAVAFAGGAMVSRRFESQMTDWGPWFWVYFALVQVALLALVYGFARVDWRRTVQDRRLRWMSFSPRAGAPRSET